MFFAFNYQRLIFLPPDNINRNNLGAYISLPLVKPFKHYFTMNNLSIEIISVKRKIERYIYNVIIGNFKKQVFSGTSSRFLEQSYCLLSHFTVLQSQYVSFYRI